MPPRGGLSARETIIEMAWENSRNGHWWLIDGELIEAQPGEAYPVDGA
jgi:hypothetical protein